MNISKIAIKKLYNYYDYEIDLGKEITIIHGPNGCGKTTILKLIDALFNNRTYFISKTEFESITIYFDDKTKLMAIRSQYGSDDEQRMRRRKPIYYLVYKVKKHRQKEQVYDFFDLDNEANGKKIKHFLSSPRPLPYLRRVDADVWNDMRLGDTIDSDEVLSRYGDAILQRFDSPEEIFSYVPDEVKQLLDSIDIRVITADRLTVQSAVRKNSYSDEEIKIDDKVNILAKDIAGKIQKAIQDYGLVSQSKDRTFPLRVLQNQDILDIDEVKRRMIELETKRTELVETGILEEDNAINMQELVNSITIDNLQTLSLYTTDTEEKLGVLSELSKSITLFKSLVENKFTNKLIKFGKDFGIKFETTYSSSPIAPNSLSSGEQHELVMLYDLVFNTSKNTLVLIDEPELSLHIEWQLEYLEDLTKIIDIAGFRALIATHSPQIINNRWDLTVSLVGGKW